MIIQVFRQKFTIHARVLWWKLIIGKIDRYFHTYIKMNFIKKLQKRFHFYLIYIVWKMKWDIDIVKDGRTEIPPPLIEGKGWGILSVSTTPVPWPKTIVPLFNFLFSHTKLVKLKIYIIIFLYLKRTKYEYIMSTRRHHHLSIKSKPHSIVCSPQHHFPCAYITLFRVICPLSPTLYYNSLSLTMYIHILCSTLYTISCFKILVTTAI